MRNFGFQPKEVEEFTATELKEAHTIGFVVGVITGVFITICGLALWLYAKGLIW